MSESKTPAECDAAEGVGDWRVVCDDRDCCPMWWTVADAAGNEIDISTTKNRD